MASSQSSTISSGYGSEISGTINARYACYWLDSCQGQHELNQCPFWRQELRGKLGIYYAEDGAYQTFNRDSLSRADLSHNQTGCTTVHLLIYTIRPEGEKQILFGLCKRKENLEKSHQCLRLAFPSSKPRKRNECGIPIVQRALEWISNRSDFVPENGFMSRFLFQHASAIYPLYLTNKEANTLTENFTPNEIFRSLHWFSLKYVLEKLPPWENYLSRPATIDELAQHKECRETGIRLGDYYLWSVTAGCLMCIREHIRGGFETFLKCIIGDRFNSNSNKF